MSVRWATAFRLDALLMGVELIIIILHFISSEPAFWATLPLYSTVDCTVGGSKESRVGTVTLYGCPADAGVAMWVHLHHGLLSVLSLLGLVVRLL